MTWVDIALCITSNRRCAKKSRGAGIYLDTGGGELSRGGSRRGAELGDAVGDAMGELGVRSAPMLFLFSIIARGGLALVGLEIRRQLAYYVVNSMVFTMEIRRQPVYIAGPISRRMALLPPRHL